MKLRNLRTGEIVATHVQSAANFITRGVGLLGRAAVEPHEGLWIRPCSSIHTLGMRATIDVFFLDRNDTVLRIVPAAAPGKLMISCRGAASVVELGSGSERPERGVAIGDRLALE
jgi:uncharacterized membrane protein (UPF0127 family)